MPRYDSQGTIAVVILRRLRSKYVELAHGAHLGADSCIRRARETIFWPGMAADLRSAIEKCEQERSWCEACARFAPHQQKEPLCQPETPRRAWSSVSADIMSMEGKQYLVTVDALSGFFEIDPLRQLTAQETIQKLRMHFARYGTPNRLITDNGPPFGSEEFRRFSQSWRFEHVTSSPHYPRGNGQAEAAVKVAKGIMRKVQREKEDVYKALLDHRNTPRSTTGLSPVEILMQRKTRTATLPQGITPTTNERTARHNRDRRQRQVKKHHDKTAAPLPPLAVGTRVWFAKWHRNRESWARGQVTEGDGRSYIIITTSNGTQYRRNRVQIRIDLTTKNDDSDTDDDTEVTTKEPNEPRKTARREVGGYGFVPPTHTRSGRTIKPVQR